MVLSIHEKLRALENGLVLTRYIILCFINHFIFNKIDQSWQQFFCCYFNFTIGVQGRSGIRFEGFKKPQCKVLLCSGPLIIRLFLGYYFTLFLLTFYATAKPSFCETKPCITQDYYIINVMHDSFLYVEWTPCVVCNHSPLLFDYLTRWCVD